MRSRAFGCMARLALVVLSLAAFSAQAASSGSAGAVDPDADYDRLDGHGASGKRVDVIEWEGNLEIHVYPGGSLKGLALKLDKRNKDKPVMVIGYRLSNAPRTQLIRRAILGIDLHEGFKAYRDPSSGSEYDKIVISNNGLSDQVVAYNLDPPPSQLYPDGYPGTQLADGNKKTPDRAPASVKQRPQADASSSAEPGADADADANVPGGVDQDDGTIKPFFSGSSRH